MKFSKLTLIAGSLLALSACASAHPELALSEQPLLEQQTASLDELASLPEPSRRLSVAVYRFDDLTGQNKPNENFSEYSRAVTQGGATILVQALEKAGGRKWFTTVERASLPSVLQERQIIRATREEYGGRNQPALPPMSFAGIILDGGIIGYDSNTFTGGLGAKFLGIGGDVKYRRDTVTVYLRAIAVQTGEILKSVSTTKTIYSVGAQGGAFRYVGFKELLEVETGFTTNEPPTLAVRQAIEKSVYSLVVEGLVDGYWSLKDQSLAQPLIDRHWQQRDGVFGVSSVKTTLEDFKNGQNGTQIAPPPSTEPSVRPSPEGQLQPQVQPGLPPAPPAPVYVIPDGQGRNPIPGAPSVNR
jgi:curli production assembly/transport component CsgG